MKAVVVLLSLAVASPAAAHGFPSPTELFPRFSVGAGGGVALRGESQGPHTSVEATFSPTLFGPHLSLGFDYANVRGDAAYAYAEAGVNLVLTLAAGIGIRGGDDVGPTGATYHVFAGLPIPTEFPFSRDVVYIEPFYRGLFPAGNAQRIDEVGVLIKWSLGFERC